MAVLMTARIGAEKLLTCINISIIIMITTKVHTLFSAAEINR